MPVHTYSSKFFQRVTAQCEAVAVNNILQLTEISLFKECDVNTAYEEINFLLKLIDTLYLKLNNTEETRSILHEMLKGGHLLLDDDGNFYNELTKHFHSSIKKRISSHHSVAQQYSLSYPVTKEILFGVTLDKNGNKTTWVQFEKHNTETIINLILHFIDYLKYLVTGKNIGPFGTSEYTDSNPLVVGIKT